MFGVRGVCVPVKLLSQSNKKIKTLRAKKVITLPLILSKGCCDSTASKEICIGGSARNKDECILQEENADYLVQYPRDWIDPVEQRHPFDLRLMGIISIGEFEHRSTYDDVETFISKKTKLTEAKQEDDGTTGMQWDFLVDNKYNADVTIWFDKNQGFSPVKMRNECENGRHATIVDSESKTRWKKIKDAWVPSSSTIEQPGFLTIEMTFDWKDVNAPQDETIYRQFPLHQVP